MLENEFLKKNKLKFKIKFERFAFLHFLQSVKMTSNFEFIILFNRNHLHFKIWNLETIDTDIPTERLTGTGMIRQVQMYRCNYLNLTH